MSDQVISLIPISLISPGDNDRKVFNAKKLASLASSIRSNGLAQPIVVQPTDNGYKIVAGERRFRAVSTILQWETIPCIVRVLDERQASSIMLAENTGREDLNPIEEARAYHKRLAIGWQLSEISETSGVSQDTIKRRVSLLRLREDVQQLVATGNLPIGHAEAMTSLDNNRQLIAISVYNQSTWMPLAAFQQVCDELRAEQDQQSLFDIGQFWVQQVAERKTPRRGKHAVTGAPTRKDLPPVIQDSSRDSTADIIDRYIAELLQAGLTAEAGAIGTLYDSLVRLNYLTVPLQSALIGGSNE